MKSIVYVPQGRSAMMHEYSSLCGIEGLFTDGFSTCNIVVIIGAQKIALLHLDTFLLSPKLIEQQLIGVQAEIMAVAEIQSAYIYLKSTGEKLYAEIESFFKRAIPTLNFEKRIVECKGDSGVLVLLKSQTTFEFDIRILEEIEAPKNLIFHPLQQTFEAVQKIERIIGWNAKRKVEQIPLKKMRVFDGTAWDSTINCCLTIDNSHPDTQAELALFKAEYPFFQLLEKLRSIQDSHHVTSYIEDPEGFGVDSAKSLEGFLNNFDHDFLFKRNLSCLLDGYELTEEQKKARGFAPITSQDKAFVKEMKSYLESKKFDIDKITNLVKFYIKNSPKTLYQDNFFKEVKYYTVHFEERERLAKIYENYSANRKRSISLSKMAVNHHQKGDYDKAYNLFLDALSLMITCSTSDKLGLAKTFYNLGRCAYQLEEYPKAKFLLDYSLYLKNNHTEPKVEIADIVKTKNVLAECESMLLTKAAPKFTLNMT